MKPAIENAILVLITTSTLLGFCIQVLCLEADETQYEVTVEIEHKSQHSNRLKRSATLFPEELCASFRVQETHVNLRLKRADHIHPNVPVYMQIDGKIKKRKVPKREHHVFYQDVEHLAAVSVKCLHFNQENSVCRYQMSGQLMINGEQHTIEPLSVDHNSSSAVPASQHKITLIRNHVDFTSDYVYQDSFDIAHQQKMVENITTSTRRVRRQAVAYFVEVFSVTDFPIYQYWYNASTEVDHEAKSNDAINTIMFLQAHLFNSMDIRYQSISAHTSDFTITPIFRDIFIAHDPSLSPWTENNTVSAFPRDHVDSLNSLQSFRDWLGTTEGLPVYDHAMGFTGYDLTSDDSPGIAGLAYVGGVCGSYAVSIVEHQLDPVFAVVASHELGHNLNSSHDGYGNSCPGSNINVMSPSTGASSDPATNNNHFFFSSCSVTYFAGFIDTLNSDAAVNCMVGLSSGYDQTALDEYTSSLPGEGFSLDDQCRTLMDSDESFFCRSFYTDPSLVCQYILCAIPGETSCSTKFAWDGTQCGNNKMCINGQCVEDSRAPASLSDTCVFGDEPGNITNGLPCSGLVPLYPYICYESHSSNYDIRCCESCAAEYTCEPGCEYGDKHSVCVLSNCPFYTNESLASCCGTCASTPLQCTSTTNIDTIIETTTTTTATTTITTPTTTPTITTPTTTPTITTTTPTTTTITTPTTTPTITTTTPTTTTTIPSTTTPITTITNPTTTSSTPITTTTTPTTTTITTTTPTSTTITPTTTTPNPTTTSSTPITTTTTPTTTTTTITTTTPTTTTITPTTTTTTPTTTTSTPITTTTTPTTTTTAITTTPYIPTTTTSTPPTPITTPTSTTTTPTTTTPATTRPTTTTTTPTTTTPTTTTSNPTTTTTTITTTTPTSTTITPTTTTTNPTTTSSTPITTTTTPTTTTITTTPNIPTTTTSTPPTPITTPTSTTTTPTTTTTTSTPTITTTTSTTTTTTLTTTPNIPTTTTSTPPTPITTPTSTTTTPTTTTTTPATTTPTTTTPTTTTATHTTTTQKSTTATSTITLTTPTSTTTTPTTTTTTTFSTTSGNFATAASGLSSLNQQSVSTAELSPGIPEMTIYVTVATVGVVGTAVAVVFTYKCFRCPSKVAPLP